MLAGTASVQADGPAGKAPIQTSVWSGPAVDMDFVDPMTGTMVKAPEMFKSREVPTAGNSNLRGTGSCCDPNGVCSLAATAAACPAGSLFFTPGTACAPEACNIACCGPDGSCVFAANWNACAWIGFSPAPVAEASVCTPNPCIQPACAAPFAGGCQTPPAITASGAAPAGVNGSSSDSVPISGTNPDFNTADNFRAAATGNISQLCFYGFFGGGGAFAAIPDAAAMSFRVRYYADVAGKPGNVLPGGDLIIGGATPTAGTSLNLSNFFYNARFLYNNTLVMGFSVTHPNVPVTSGNCYWVEIVHLSAVAGNPANRFRWLTSEVATDSYFIQKNAQVDPVSNPYAYTDLQVGLGDKAFCVNIATASPAGTGCTHLARPANAACSTAQTVTLTGTTPFVDTNKQTISADNANTALTPFCDTVLASSTATWYRVVGNGNTLTASTCGANTGFDTVLMVFCGTCTGSGATANNTGLFCVASNDTGPATCTGGAGSDPSQVSWPSVAGRTYLIMVGGFQLDAGFYDFNLVSDATPVTGPAACASDRCNVTLPAQVETEACGALNQGVSCADPAGIFTFGTAFGGTNSTATNGLSRDFDFWELNNIASPIPDNGGGLGWVDVTYETEFPVIFNFFDGACDAANGNFLGGVIDNYKPCGPKLIQLQLTAGGNFRINLTQTDFGGNSCASNDNNYSITVSASVVGACCAQGTCFIDIQADCVDVTVGGVYQGNGSVCTPDPCNVPATGACCCGSACIITTQAACSGTNRVFTSAGTTCTPFSNTVPCCRGDYNKTGGAPTVQDIFDFLSGYFSTDACANTNDTVDGMGNPTVSVQDIFDFLAAYFGGC